MSKYPNWQVGSSVSAVNLASMLPDIYVKAASQSRATTAVVADDAELTGIPLAVGQHWVRFLILFYTDTSATPDFKTQWGFSGTWNNPIRASIGPPSSNTAAAGAVTPMLLGGIAAGTDGSYGSASGTANAYIATEESFNVVVTVAGNLSLKWSQRVSDATNTTVLAGTTCMTRQIA